MNRELLAEELDRQIEQMRNAPGLESSEFRGLLALADEVSLLPSCDFKAQLKADLLERAEAEEAGQPVNITESGEFAAFDAQPLRTLEQQGDFAMLPADPRSFLLSFVSHAAVVVLIASGIWMGRNTIEKSQPLISKLMYTPLPAGDSIPHGGGSGGDRSTVPVSRGTPPKFTEQQLAPPAIVVRNPAPKLQVEASVLGPPQLRLPQSNQLGDLLSSNVAIPSNGTGSAGGMGSNSGTGIGAGNGPGVGSGTGGGCCTGAFRPGNGVFAPRAIYDPEPEYSEEARKAKHQGIVVLSIVVDPTGRARDVRIARSLGMGLDEKAIEAVQKWKFAPGTKDGVPVAVQVNVEVTFRLY